jgi:hypothetical protein
MKPYCHHNLDEVRTSGLLSPERMAAIDAEIESRISEPRTADGRPIASAKLATFPDGTLMLYPRMDHDPEGQYLRRELLAAILTPEELKLVNRHSLAAQSARRDAARFEKAAKLTEWDGWVTDGDHYWDSVGTYLDERENEDWEHTYLWVATPHQIIPHLDASDITEHWITDRGWEECDLDAFDGVEELQAALDHFVEANQKVVSYSPDYTRAVLLDSYLAAQPA